MIETIWPLDDDKANFAVLHIEYPKFLFTGGYFSTYEPCSLCDADTIPLSVYRSPPSENDALNHYILTYGGGSDTIFHSSYGPWGADIIFIPDSLFPSEEFSIIDSSANEPITLTLLKSKIILTGQSGVDVKIDSAWNAIKYLDIVHDFALKEYHVGIVSYSIKSIAFFLYR